MASIIPAMGINEIKKRLRVVIIISEYTNAIAYPKTIAAINTVMNSETKINSISSSSRTRRKRGYFGASQSTETGERSTCRSMVVSFAYHPK